MGRTGWWPLSHSQAHLDGSTLESWLDVLRNHVDVGLPLRWWVRQVCVLRLQETASGKKEHRVGEGQGSRIRTDRQAKSNDMH